MSSRPLLGWLGRRVQMGQSKGLNVLNVLNVLNALNVLTFLKCITRRSV